ncbi:poly-gamma-glutamate hydrolase family protein [Pelagivirga sediminicola]|nr:poly-gamma-glutamate hydrolase family protein [Pelagivirga sediminicola]
MPPACACGTIRRRWIKSLWGCDEGGIILFVGGHGDLHITSHRFDEPNALNLVGRPSTAVAIHGRKDDGSDKVWLGGRSTYLRVSIGAALRNACFGAELHKALFGVYETNICNRSRSGEGVQLELSRSLRRRLAT